MELSTLYSLRGGRYEEGGEEGMGYEKGGMMMNGTNHKGNWSFDTVHPEWGEYYDEGE